MSTAIVVFGCPFSMLGEKPEQQQCAMSSEVWYGHFFLVMAVLVQVTPNLAGFIHSAGVLQDNHSYYVR